MSSAILFHCATVFPGGSAADALGVMPADAARANVTTAIAATRRACVLLRFIDAPPFGGVDTGPVSSASRSLSFQVKTEAQPGPRSPPRGPRPHGRAHRRRHRELVGGIPWWGVRLVASRGRSR